MDHFLAAFGGVTGAVAVIGLLIRVIPTWRQHLVDSMFSQADPSKLKQNSPLAEHFNQFDQLADRQDHMLQSLRDLQADAISTTIVQLIHLPNDNSAQIAAQITKLEKFDDHNWAIQVGRDYIANHAVKK